jgi:branched-chain amino acid transport system substrate-binding protein
MAIRKQKRIKMKTKIALGICIIAIIAGILVAGCTTQQQSKIRIGVIAPLSGFLASAGQDTTQALQIALEELPQQDVELVYEDGACDASKAITAYQKLSKIDDIKYLIGPYCGQSAVAILPLLNKDKIVSISSGAPDNELAKPSDYFFRTQIPNALETKKIAEFLIQKNIKNVATYTAKNTFGESYKNSFIEQFKKLGGNILISEGSLDYQADFKTEITKIMNKSPEAIFLVTASRNQMGIFVKQAKELDYKGIIIGGSITEEQELLDAAGSAAEGALYVHYVDKQNLSEKQKKFFAKFNQKFGKDPGVRVLTAYDAFEILYSAIKQCEIKNTECVRQKLNLIKDYEGVTGKISFNENGDAEIPLIIKTVKNSEFIAYKG